MTNMADKCLVYKTTLTVTVLSDSPLAVCDLVVIADRMDSGDLVGSVEQGESIGLTNDEAIEALEEVGCDGSFFEELLEQAPTDWLADWTDGERRLAEAEGWMLALDEDGDPVIQRVDEVDVFSSDEAAYAYVAYHRPTHPHCAKAFAKVHGRTT